MPSSIDVATVRIRINVHLFSPSLHLTTHALGPRVYIPLAWHRTTYGIFHKISTRFRFILFGVGYTNLSWCTKTEMSFLRNLNHWLPRKLSKWQLRYATTGENFIKTATFPFQIVCILTQWGRDRMDAISQTTFSSAFSWIKMFELRFIFHWGLFLRVSINYILALVQIMAWRRPGDKPLSEPMMVRLPTHICVTRPRWVNAQVFTNILRLLHYHWRNSKYAVALVEIMIFRAWKSKVLSNERGNYISNAFPYWLRPSR